MEENVWKGLGNINNLFEAIISLFSVDSEGNGEGGDSVKDPLVFHGVPKDTIEENVGKDLGVIIYFLMLQLLYLVLILRVPEEVMIPSKIIWFSMAFLKILWRKMLGFRGIEVIIDTFFSLFSVDSEGTGGGDDSLVFHGY